MAARKVAARPYYIRHKETGAERLVEAGNVAQALRHVAGDTYEARPATTREAHDLATRGVKIETAVKEAPEPPAAA
jgi:hypothetical protein